MMIMGTITFIKPPFNEETARAKVKAAQDTWNTRNPEHVAQAYTSDFKWSNRSEFFTGREAIITVTVPVILSTFLIRSETRSSNSSLSI
jgi:nuclear transport factor 2 (NTF2) superfamily protein